MMEQLQYQYLGSEVIGILARSRSSFKKFLRGNRHTREIQVKFQKFSEAIGILTRFMSSFKNFLQSNLMQNCLLAICCLPDNILTSELEIIHLWMGLGLMDDITYPYIEWRTVISHLVDESLLDSYQINNHGVTCVKIHSII